MKQSTVVIMSMVICLVILLIGAGLGMVLKPLSGIGIAIISSLLAVGFAGGIRNIN